MAETVKAGFTSKTKRLTTLETNPSWLYGVVD